MTTDDVERGSTKCIYVLYYILMTSLFLCKQWGSGSDSIQNVVDVVHERPLIHSFCNLHLASPHRKLPPVPGQHSNYNTIDRLKNGRLKGLFCFHVNMRIQLEFQGGSLLGRSLGYPL